MTYNDELFIRTLRDLREREAAEDPYEVLGIAALLRKLFFEAQPLIDQVNRYRKIPVRFRVLTSDPLPDEGPKPFLSTAQDWLDPDTSPWPERATEIDRKQLFRTVVFTIDGHEQTVRDVVLFEAHVMGAVHRGAPDDAKQRALEETGNRLRVGGYPAPLRQLKAIARITLKGLEPLRSAIEAGQPS